jgi:diguanylate cyclase (GGDEF)-like protein
MDLDHFKDVNDTLGHPAGDKLLCEVAQRIHSVTRISDIVARLGGDEFAILAGEADSKAALASMATRVVEVTGAPYTINGQIVFVGASVGIAIAPFDGTDPDTLMKNADMALYRAKSEGRGRFAFFEPGMEQHVAERQRIERELHDAMATGSLDLYYQPIIKVASRRVIGFEALMRWQHPTRGLVPPAEFIPIAEENGFIVALGEWALNKACLEAARWPQDIKVAINLSSIQFRSGSLVPAVVAALEASGLAASRLELEITESAMMRNADAAIAKLSQLKALGIHIAMDDFGTGYSSLAYLQRFPFDKVKIDRTFVHDIRQTTNLAIIRAVADIAASMGITTLAEGVETEEQFDRVAAEHCDEVQGYLFSPARPPSDVQAMLAYHQPPAVMAEIGTHIASA